MRLINPKIIKNEAPAKSVSTVVFEVFSSLFAVMKCSDGLGFAQHHSNLG